MKPEATRILEHTMTALLGEIAPAMTPAYRQASVSALGALLLCVREEFDRAASRRIDENRALRGLFARASEVAVDDALVRRLREAAGEDDPDFRVPALETANQALRRLLVDLHAHLEGLESAAARALEDELWGELVRSVERRRVSLQAF